MGDGLGIS